VRYLVDTHALIWWWLGSPLLSASARAQMEAPESAVFVSPVSVLEIAIKVRRGQLSGLDEALANLDEDLKRDGFTHLPISHIHAREAGLLKDRHGDPFDRLLAAQAISEDLTLLTRDGKIAALGCRTLW
jgi:PIN domain nuclease of toxin-antitoxin system